MPNAAIQKNPRPWASVAGLAAACVVTLIGVARGTNPDVVLFRAAIAAGAVGVVVSVTASLAQRLAGKR